MIFADLGVLPFNVAFKRQEQVVEEVAYAGRDETVHLLEHPHVFTVGRAGSAANLLASLDLEGRPIELVRINRGGDVTYHGPGQLVGYPHLDLRKRGRDVHRYLRQLEECLIETASSLGVKAFRRKGLTGVWTETGKLASIGVGVRHWVTLHGFALNVNTDLRYFQLINPCGIVDCPMTSLQVLLGSPVPMEQVKGEFQRCFQEVFEKSTPSAIKNR